MKHYTVFGFFKCLLFLIISNYFFFIFGLNNRNELIFIVNPGFLNFQQMCHMLNLKNSISRVSFNHCSECIRLKVVYITQQIRK